jgi:alpha-amylase
MCTKWFSDGDVHKYFNPYDTPYEAFINFMNALSDFKLRLDKAQTSTDTNSESDTIKDAGEIDILIKDYEKKLLELKKLKQKTNPSSKSKNQKTAGKKTATAKPQSTTPKGTARAKREKK